jgi:hypothetical protein
MTLKIPEADKVTVDLSFIALDNEQRTGLEGLKAGTRPTQALEEPFNTTYDVTRTKMTIIDVTNSNPTPLFGYASEITLTINNNVSPNKAIGVLGGFDTTAGLFEIGGESSVYFSSIPALQAIRNNADVDWDVWLQHDNQALMFDIGLLTLGDGRLEVELDEPIMAPLTNEGAENKFGHTLLMGIFYYLPDAAGGG